MSAPRAIMAGVGVLATLLVVDARAADAPLVGLFEGHGIAPPADANKARAAIAAAERLRTPCHYIYQNDWGGIEKETKPCQDVHQQLASLGRDAAAALLDVLDRPREPPLRWLERDGGSWLVSALADTGREDLVPVLITALERLAARAKAVDERVSRAESQLGDDIEAALGALAFLRHDERPSNAIAGWRDWWEHNQTGKRADWRRAAIARARHALATAEARERQKAAFFLADFPETRAEALGAVKRMVRDHECGDDPECWEARRFLQGREPHGKWLPEHE